MVSYIPSGTVEEVVAVEEGLLPLHAYQSLVEGAEGGVEPH